MTTTPDNYDNSIPIENVQSLPTIVILFHIARLLGVNFVIRRYVVTMVMFMFIALPFRNSSIYMTLYMQHWVYKVDLNIK